MFRKILICAMFATAAGYCFAAESLPQVVTSEVFYEQEKVVDEGQWEQVDTTTYDVVETYETYREIPAWPLAGSEADVDVSCTGGVASKKKQSDNIRIVSKIGTDLVVENNFNLGVRGDEWSGGANMLHGTQIPVGFADECSDESEMPLLHREVLEDDGGNVLAVSRSGRKNCGKYADGYEAFATKMGMKVENVTEDTEIVEEETEIEVAESADAQAPVVLTDQVRSWVVANGQTLREVLQNWCNKEGWDLVWATSREYPIEASAVFKGRFVDVASALVRNFGRATPIPYAKFYKGN
ncbi:MAG: toxin co-regulated pilus biosynthesis Q family protein, partial [Alphaproteobacteria bacterium]|nr:toxin co-regulated pilus biosynthesis Q family protein [Alphaproteobacteria bacterium]